MERADGDIDELIEFWTLLDEDRKMLVGKRGASRHRPGQCGAADPMSRRAKR